MIDVVWITKKVRHLIEISRKSFTIIFTNHFALIDIAKQTSLTTVNTNKLNLRLIKASQYLSSLSIEIRVKSEKFHIILDAFSRLFFIMNKDELKKKKNSREYKIRFEQSFNTFNQRIENICLRCLLDTCVKVSRHILRAKRIHDRNDE
jgi:hypothetical protein